jgi:hypothetical protein
MGIFYVWRLPTKRVGKGSFFDFLRKNILPKRILYKIIVVTLQPILKETGN